MAWSFGQFLLLCVVMCCMCHADSQATECERKLDIVFLIDESSSVREFKADGRSVDNWALTVNFVVDVLSFFKIGPQDTQVSVVTFATQARVRWSLNRHSTKGDLNANIRRLLYDYRGGATNTAAGLRKVTDEVLTQDRGDRPDASNLVVILTDGIPTVAAEQLNDEIERLQDKARVFSVGVTSTIDKATLRLLSSPPHEENKNFWYSRNFYELRGIINSVATEVCRRQAACKQADIGLLIDSSDSITDADWRKLKNFLKEFIKALNVGLNKVRIGAIQFSDRAYHEFYLNRYATSDEVLNAIDSMIPRMGKTNTADGLRRLREDLFRRVNGDRLDVENIAVIITDGVSTVAPSETIHEAGLTKNAGIRIIAVGITDRIEMPELREIASEREEVIRADFETLNNKLDSILTLACEGAQQEDKECPFQADIALILDVSTSITWLDVRNWNPRLTGFVKELIVRFPIGENSTKISIVTFSDYARMEFDLNRHRSEQSLLDSISNIKHRGGETNLYDGLRIMRQTVFQRARGDRPEIANIAIVITDGQANLNELRTIPEARRAKAEGVEIFCVGITNDVAMDELKAIASSDNFVFTASNFSQLEFIIRDLINRTCALVSTTQGPTTPTPSTTERITTPTTTIISSTSSATPTPSTPSTTTYRSTTSRSTTPTTTRSTTPTTTPRPIPGCVGKDADVVFVLDASGSIEKHNFQNVLNFLARLFEELNINQGKVRVGVMTYSDQPRREFHLNAFSRASDAIAALQNVRYTRGTTNTAAALSYLRADMFREENGDRSNVHNIAVLLADGESDDKDSTLRQAKLTRASGVHIITVGVGHWIDRHELESMASYPYNLNFLFVDKFGDLPRFKDIIRDAVCDNRDECINFSCKNGGTCRNGIRHKICICPPGFSGSDCGDRCDTAADIIFLLDASGSIGKENFRKVKDFVTQVVEQLDIDSGKDQYRGVRIGMATFGNNERLEFHLNEYIGSKSELLGAINVRYTAGTTNTAAALRFMRERMFRTNRGDRSTADNIAVVITDGRSDDGAKTWTEAMQCRKAGIQIIAVGVGGGVNKLEMKGMASFPTSSNVLAVENFDYLNQNLIDKISGSVCNKENTCNSHPCQNGARCTRVVNGYVCGPCPNGYTGTHCERGCDGRADVVFVLDSSGSIRHERFPDVLNFVEMIVRKLDIAPTRVRVGLVYWSNNAAVQFHLNQYEHEQDVIQAIHHTPFLGFRTNTASALYLARTVMFKPERGDRDGVPNFAIVITDGNSNINPRQTIAEAKACRVDLIHIMAVAVGKSFVNKLEMEGIANEPTPSNLFNVTVVTDLPRIVDNVVMGTCDDQNECLSGPCRNGGTCHNRLFRYWCECYIGYTGYNCERRCSRQLDLVFVLDLSGSVEDRYRLVINFAKKIVFGLDVPRARIGAVTYSTDVNDQFYMNSYNSKEGVINALNFYREGGRTNTQAALRVMREHYTGARGERPGVRNVAVVITDGYANVIEENTAREALRAKNENIDIYAVAIGEGPNMGKINEMSSDPDSDFVMRLKSSNDIDSVSNRLLDHLCR